jgi:hypothetical protein
MNLDPESIDARLYKQVSKLLEQLETSSTVSLRERIQALVAIARIQTIFMTLRQKGNKDDPTVAGSSVRKYESAFQAHDARRRKAIARAAAEADDDDGDDLLELDDGDDRDSA